jgi:inosine/xanthosine triphosphatase
MLVSIGSLNKIKIEGVREAFEEFYNNISIKAVDIQYMNQPLSLEDTVKGAIYRARKAKDDADYGVGVESGLINILDYHLVIHVAAIINDNLTIGFSPAFQLPKAVERLVLKGIELDKAVERLYNIRDIGEKRGIIEILSKKRIDRKVLIIDAVKMALVKIINK